MPPDPSVPFSQSLSALFHFSHWRHTRWELLKGTMAFVSFSLLVCIFGFSSFPVLTNSAAVSTVGWLAFLI